MGTNGVYENPRNTPIDSIPESTPKNPPESSESSPEYTMRGYLHRGPSKWSKEYCIISENCLKCYTAENCSTLKQKVFLPGSKIVNDTDVNRQWAFKVEQRSVHHFAAESREDYEQWMKALQSALSIEVQKVPRIEDIKVEQEAFDSQHKPLVGWQKYISRYMSFFISKGKFA